MFAGLPQVSALSAAKPRQKRQGLDVYQSGTPVTWGTSEASVASAMATP